MPHNSELYYGLRFSELLKNLTPSFQEYFHAEEAHIIQLILPESKILEIGCGSGRVMKRMAHTALNGLVAGIDYSNLQLEDAVQEFSGAKNVELYLQDGRHLAFKDNYFDIACLPWNLLGSYDYGNQIAFLKEAGRVVKLDGLVIASAFSENALPFQIEQYHTWGWQYEESGEDFVQIIQQGFPVHVNRFTAEDLNKLFKDAGFMNTHIDKIAGIAYIVEARK